MRSVIHIERKRILHWKVFLLFIMLTVLFSGRSSQVSVNQYEIWDQEKGIITGSENLKHGKENTKGKYLNEEYLLSLQELLPQKSFQYVEEENAENIVLMNYKGKRIEELTKQEMEKMYSIRLRNIEKMLTENRNIRYSEMEKKKLLEKASALPVPISMEYAEGWKNINADMGAFLIFLILLIAMLILPLFASENQTKMKELYRSAKYGKKRLDRARVLTAYAAGGFLYFIGAAVYFLIKMLPFGLEGGGQMVQSDPGMFFSVYSITYQQQFIINLFLGLLVMAFVVSLTLLVSVLTEEILTGAVLLLLFWFLLFLFEQVYLYPVNHYFANFMPLRMLNFTHYYTGNEIYRPFGSPVSCLLWTIIVSSILSIITLFSAIKVSDIKRKWQHIHFRHRRFVAIRKTSRLLFK